MAKRFVLLINGVPFFDENNKFCGYRGVDKNITQYKEAERKLQNKIEELEKSQ